MNYNNNLKQELSTANTYENNWLDKRSVVDRRWRHMAANFGMFDGEE